MPQQQIGLTPDVMRSIADLYKIYDEFSRGLEIVKQAHANFESVKQGVPGMAGTSGRHGKDGKDGRDGMNVTPEMVQEAVSRLYVQPKDGAAPDEEQVAQAIMASPKFLKFLKKSMNPGKEGILPDMDLLTSKILEEVRKQLPDPSAWDNKLAEMRDSIRRESTWRGGGDTVVAGSGVTITNTPNGNKRIAATGSGFTVITVTGVIDDSNTTFTVASQPTLLNINGQFYQKTGGAITWTYVAGTITISVPVGTGGSIFGI